MPNRAVRGMPQPARYALHKLIVYGEREGTFAAKAMKDLRQAASLLAYDRAHRPWEIEEARADLVSRGKTGSAGLDRGLPHWTGPIRISKRERGWQAERYSGRISPTAKHVSGVPENVTSCPNRAAPFASVRATSAPGRRGPRPRTRSLARLPSPAAPKIMARP
jgi:hypothetical protein